MNKRQKAILDGAPGVTMTPAEWELATDDYKELRKDRKMNAIKFKEYQGTITEGKFSKKDIDKAIKIAKRSSGNMTAAVIKIDKMKKGLADDPAVMDALRQANEQVQEGKAYPVMNASQRVKIIKIAKKHSGDMQRAIKEIDKIRKNLSDNPDVMDILRQANESVEIDERDYRKEYDNYQGTPDQIARRSSRNKARRVMGDDCEEGKDVGHKDNDPMNNDRANLRNEDPSKNRREPRLRKEAGPRAIPMKVLLKKYHNNEDDNQHSENYLLLAKTFGTPKQVKEVEAILKRNKKQGHTSEKDNKWMYKNINPYYKKLVTASKNESFESSVHTPFSQYLSEGIFDPKDGEKWAKEIQKGINAPVVQVTTSSLGGAERMSLMIKFSMDKEAAKGGTNWHNSNHANLRVDIGGSMEMFQRKSSMGKALRKSKVKSTKDVIKKINDWIGKLDIKEESLAEAYKYKIDHKTYTDAVEEALKVAEKAKYDVDMDDYFNTVATGPRKPSEGKTNKFKINLTKNGKEQRKKLQIQIYGKGKHGYELNCYIA